MQRILGKRIIRDIRSNLSRYLALFFLISIGVFVIITTIGGAETVIKCSEENETNHLLEDGEFALLLPMEEELKSKLNNKKISIEENFYLDFAGQDETVLRVFKNREKINLAALSEGKIPVEDHEALVEKIYALKNNISLGDSIKIGSKKLIVCGIGSTPDYNMMTRNLSDVGGEIGVFGTVFVTEGGFQEIYDLAESLQSVNYLYSYLLNGEMTHKELRQYLQEHKNQNITMFLESKDNPRIGYAEDDIIINKIAGIFAGIIVLFLFSYVISVFVVNAVDKESAVIGTLYSMGINDKQLLGHYMVIPIVVTFIGGLTGTLFAYFYGIRWQTKEYQMMCSMPDFKVLIPLYVWAYGLILPSFMALLINYYVIKNRLKSSALSLLQNEKKQGSKKQLKLEKLGFINAFRIRQIFREGRTSLTVLGAMFVCLLVVMIGLNCQQGITRMKNQVYEDVRFSYMYTYKYPDIDVPIGGEPAYAVTLKKEIWGNNMDVTLLGITQDNPYFKGDIEEGKNKVTVSSSFAEKFKIKTGDDIILRDEINEIHYAFTVSGLTQYACGMYVFMDLNSMRDLFGKEDSYYNVVFSDQELDIDSNLLYGVSERDDFTTFTNTFMEMMMPMIITLTVLPILILIVVIYLMEKVMLDHSALYVSLFKIFGYKNTEVKKIYVDGNMVTIIISAFISIPLSKIIMDLLFPFMVSNVAIGFDSSFEWWLYPLIFFGIVLCHIIVNGILLTKINKVMPNDILKVRE